MFRSRRILQIATLALITCFCSWSVVKAQTYQYKKEAASMAKQIRQDFFMPDKLYYKENAVPQPKDHEVSFLWPLCALIQADNEMERLFPGKSYMKETFAIIEKYDDQSPPAPGYDSYPAAFSKEDRYYDDNQWIGIAAMDAYFRTRQATDLEMGKKIYQFMMTGCDTVSGGGIYWREGDMNTKNTCSNGPAIILLMQLHQATKDPAYLKEALEIYNWTNAHLRSPEHLFYDNLNVKTGELGKHFYSYNAGTMLQSNVYLYEATKDKKFLEEAKRIAGSATQYFLGKGQFRDDYWFNAVLLRGFEHLYKHDKDNQYLKAFQVCTDHSLQQDRNNNGLMGKKKTHNLVGQGGMLEILARLGWLQQQKTI